MLRVARIQLEHEKKTRLINAEIEKIDAELVNLDSSLQQAEGALSTMLDSTHASVSFVLLHLMVSRKFDLMAFRLSAEFSVFTLQLESVGKALANPLNVDDLIRFAHRISASFAIAAPPDFVSVAVDARRPYPTDIQLRAGWLAQQAASTAVQGAAQMSAGASTAGGQLAASAHALPSASASAPGLTPTMNVAAGPYSNAGTHAYTPFGGASNCEFMSSSSSESESSADEQ